MAQVTPQITGSIAPDATPPQDYQRVDSSPAAFGALVGQGMQRLGAGAVEAGNAGLDVALMAQQRHNQVAGDNGINQFQSYIQDRTFGNNKDPNAPKGLYTLTGSDALEAGPDVVKQLEQKRQEIKDSLQNDAQRIQFEEGSRRILQFTSGEIGRHLTNQANVYAESVNTATMQNAVRAASNSFNSDDAVMHSIQDARGALVKTAQLKNGQNADPAIFQAATGQADNAVIRGAINGALAQQQYGRASQILTKFGTMLDPATREEMSAQVQSHADRADVASFAATPPSEGGYAGLTPEAANVNNIWQRLKTAEHGLDANGVQLVSSKGATGIAQVMPDTARETAVAHGVAWDENAYRTDNSYNEMIGRLYFGDMMKRYNGNATLATAAYNAGPGRVDQWVNTIGDPRKGVISNASFAGQIPIDEIRNYVQRVAQPEAAPTPASPNHNPQAYDVEEQYIQQKRQEAAAKWPDRPDLQHAAMQEVYQTVAQTNALQAKREAEQAKAQRDAQEAAANQVVTAFQTDPTKFDPATITNNPALTAEQKIHLMETYRRNVSGVGEGYGKDFIALYTKVTAPQGDVTRIQDPKDLWADLAAGNITPAGYEKLSAALVSRRTPEGEAEQQQKKAFFDAAHVQISMHGMGQSGRDPIGEMKFAQFMIPALTAYDAGKARGLTPAQMLDEKSPDYIGKIIKNYTRTDAQKMADWNASNNLDLGAATGGATKPAAVDLTTAQGIQAAYKSGHYGYGPAAWDAAMADLRKGGFVKIAPPAVTQPSAPTNE